MTLEQFNKDKKQAAELLSSCCGSAKWLSGVMARFPFKDTVDLANATEQVWYDQCIEYDWQDAFGHHPKIGDIKGLTVKFAATSHLAGKEQSGVSGASEKTIADLVTANAEYESKFGFIFIVCATGKSADEMLRLLLDRLRNSKEEELRVAMGEQQKITILRLKKILDEADWNGLGISQLTTHVLDTSIGKPGKDLTIRLQSNHHAQWQTLAQGVTNADGRIADLLPPGRHLKPGNYKMIFETAHYFSINNTRGFYPEVEIQFTIIDDSHYHVPLLINPFGYSTYRGS
jgi:5-hydroxyisourate hydrolase / 2-oxo-4-hydroxy-4-carboxy-5-ureidoimidazoline decarboxylase